MDKYRKTHPICEITGSKKNVQVHHIVPIWARPDLASDPNNFISLTTSANIHLLYGHSGNYADKYVQNIKEISEKIVAISENSIIINREEHITTQTIKSAIIWKAIKNWIKFIFKK